MLRREIASGSFDLCYIDPPFNSKRNYFQIYNNQGGEDRAQAFVDTLGWGDELLCFLDVEEDATGAVQPMNTRDILVDVPSRTACDNDRRSPSTGRKT